MTSMFNAGNGFGLLPNKLCMEPLTLANPYLAEEGDEISFNLASLLKFDDSSPISVESLLPLSDFTSWSGFTSTSCFWDGVPEASFTSSSAYWASLLQDYGEVSTSFKSFLASLLRLLFFLPPSNYGCWGVSLVGFSRTNLMYSSVDIFWVFLTLMKNFWACDLT